MALRCQCPVHWDPKTRICVVAGGARVLTIVACVLLLFVVVSAFGFAVATLRYSNLASYYVAYGRVNGTTALPCNAEFTTGVPVWLIAFNPNDTNCLPRHTGVNILEFGATDIVFRSAVPIATAFATSINSTSWQMGSCVPVFVPGRGAEYYSMIFRAVVTPASFSPQLCDDFVGVDRGLCLVFEASYCRSKLFEKDRFWILWRFRKRRDARWGCLLRCCFYF
jgi:hypothetical protein